MPVMVALALLAALSGCSCGRAHHVCAEAEATPIPHDANLDGRWDVADGVFVARGLLAGGTAIPCADAAEVDPFGPVHQTDLSDAFASWNALFVRPIAGTTLSADACADATPLAEPECGWMGWTIDAPKTAAAGEAFTATISLRSPDLDVEGWSIGATADGCTITGATTDGTLGADGYVGAGARKLGFDDTRTVAGGATSGVVLDWMDPTSLEPSDDERPVLVLTLQAPASGTCTIALADGVVGPANPVDTVVVHGGRSYRPELLSVDVKIK